MKITQPILTKFLFFIVLVLYLFFRLPGLGTDIANSDSIRWHHRTTNFLIALKNFDFKNTYQRYHPGITLMWSNALVKQGIQTYDIQTSENPGQITVENSHYFPLIHKISKVSQVGILSITFVLILYFVSKIFSHKIALIFGYIFALEPYLIGIDRWFHLTSLEAYFAFLSYLIVLYWLKLSGNQSKYLILGGIVFALAVLAKVTALIVLPCLVILILRKSTCFESNANLKHLGIFTISSISIVLILFPAIWYAPLFTFSKIMNGISGGVYEDIRNNPLMGLFQYLYYFVILSLKLSPITLALAILSLYDCKICAKKSLKERSYKRYILLYFFTYFIALSISSKKIDRYVIALLPPLLLYVAIFLEKFKKESLLLISALILIFSLSVKHKYYPVYSAYYSPIYGDKPIAKVLDKSFYNNSGEYFAQAAFTLNNIVDDSKVWVPYNRDSFDYFFKRDTYKDYSENMSFTVVSIDHLAEVQNKCPTILYTFGPKRETAVFILSCN